jgi:hypothetical protein
MKSLQEEYNDQPKATILVTTRYTPKIDEGDPTTLFTPSVLEGIILNPKNSISLFTTSGLDRIIPRYPHKLSPFSFYFCLD